MGPARAGARRACRRRLDGISLLLPRLILAVLVTSSAAGVVGVGAQPTAGDWGDGISDSGVWVSSSDGLLAALCRADTTLVYIAADVVVDSARWRSDKGTVSLYNRCGCGSEQRRRRRR